MRIAPLGTLHFWNVTYIVIFLDARRQSQKIPYTILTDFSLFYKSTIIYIIIILTSGQ